MVPDKTFLSMSEGILISAAVACCFASGALAADVGHAISSRVLMEENFDGRRSPGSLSDRLLQHDKVQLAAGSGPDGSNAIRVAYVGCDLGSERVVVRYPLGVRVKNAILCFDVCFEENFQWVLGGKLHGLGPAEPITGGRPRKPSSWSARAIFRPEGGVATYIYDQDPGKKYGIGKRAESPVFQKGRWHHVELHVRLNNPGQADGCVRISVGGRMMVEQDNVEFRGKGGAETEIQTFLFSTFHGGSGAKYAPLDQDGKPATVNALFDNFRVVEAL